MVIGFFALILIRSMHKATLAQFSNDMLLACGSSVSLAVQAFIIIGGVVKMIPLTGGTLPFISYGGWCVVARCAFRGGFQSGCIRNYRFAREMEGHEGNHDEYDEDDMDEEAKKTSHKR